jgi:hypothetical protein
MSFRCNMGIVLAERYAKYRRSINLWFCHSMNKNIFIRTIRSKLGESDESIVEVNEG